MKLTFITGSKDKASQLTKYLSHPVEQHTLDLEEIQSLDLKNILEHKVKSAYQVLKTPVIVDDVGFYISCLNDFPGPLIKWFDQSLGYPLICQLVSQFEDKTARGEAGIAFYDGQNLEFFFGLVEGKISPEPRGENGFGWDRILIPNGYSQTRGEMSETDYDQTSQRRVALEKLKQYLEDKK